MFKIAYLRTYPQWLQLMLLILMMFSLGSFSLVIAQLVIPGIYGVPVSDISTVGKSTNPAVRDAALLLQFVSSVVTFIVPAFMFAYFAHPRVKEYLGLRKPGKNVQWLLVITVILSAMPVMFWLDSLVKMIDFGAAIKKKQEEGERTINVLLKMRSLGDFLWVFVVMAIVPAIGEELICRGIIMRSLHKTLKVPWIAVVLSSAIFASLHVYNPYGIVAIFFAAILLGTIYYLTGSIWLSILAHLINNGTQIILQYYAINNPAVKAFTESESLPSYFPIAGFLLLTTSLFLLWKNRTPLRDNWSDDFSKEELMQREN